MSTTIALGNYLTLTANGSVRYRFQNFFINQTVSYNAQNYQFLPFGFSGVTINRQGDNTEASIILTNNELSRPWAIEMLDNRWLATVVVLSLNPADTASGQVMHSYTGQVSSGSWDDANASLEVRLNTVLDAVGADVPMRRLTQSLVGSLPTTNNVRLQ